MRAGAVHGDDRIEVLYYTATRAIEHVHMKPVPGDVRLVEETLFVSECPSGETTSILSLIRNVAPYYQQDVAMREAHTPERRL